MIKDTPSAGIVTGRPTRTNWDGRMYTPNICSELSHSSPARDPIGSRRGPRSPPINAAISCSCEPCGKIEDRERVEDRHRVVVQQRRAHRRRDPDDKDLRLRSIDGVEFGNPVYQPNVAQAERNDEYAIKEY
jgi:hypothetical protein